MDRNSTVASFRVRNVNEALCTSASAASRVTQNSSCNEVHHLFFVFPPRAVGAPFVLGGASFTRVWSLVSSRRAAEPRKTTIRFVEAVLCRSSGRDLSGRSATDPVFTSLGSVEAKRINPHSSAPLHSLGPVAESVDGRPRASLKVGRSRCS